METNAADEARRAAATLREEYGRDGADADDLDDDETFLAAVEALAESDLPPGELLKLAGDRNEFASCIALAAIDARGRVPPGFETWAWKFLRKSTSTQDTYILRALVHAEEPVIGKAMATIGQGVDSYEVALLIGARRERGEPFDLDAFQDSVPRQLQENLEYFVDANADELGPGFRELFDAWRQSTVDPNFLAGVGTLWKRPYDSPPALLSGRRIEVVDVVADALRDRGQSVVLVGEHGVGKTTLARAAAERIPDLDVLQATAGQLHAGAAYVGELETRVKEFIDNLRGKPMVWHLPDLGAALYAGQHQRSPYGMLDLVLPAVT